MNLNNESSSWCIRVLFALAFLTTIDSVGECSGLPSQMTVERTDSSVVINYSSLVSAAYSIDSKRLLVKGMPVIRGVSSLSTQRLDRDMLRLAFSLGDVEYIEIFGVYIENDALDCIDKIKGVKKIAISQTNLSDNHVENLLKCESLEVLTISNSDISDRSVYILGTMRHLRQLQLNENKHFPDWGYSVLGKILEKTEVRGLVASDSDSDSEEAASSPLK